MTYERKTHTFSEFSLGGEPIEDDRVYNIGLQTYTCTNLEAAFGITMDELNKNGSSRVVATSCIDILDEYLTEHQHLGHATDGRLTVL